VIFLVILLLAVLLGGVGLAVGAIKLVLWIALAVLVLDLIGYLASGRR